MTTGSNNPETPQANRSATTVTVAGTDYEYANMPVAEGLDIYSKLPAGYQKLADTYAVLAKRFQEKLDITLPGGMSFATAWENTIKTAESGLGFDKSPDYQKEIYAQFKEQIDQVPVMGSAVGAAETGADALGTGVAGAKGFVNVLLSLPRLVGATYNAAGEVKDRVTGALAPVTDDQAKAFGAAMAGAALYKSAAREEMSTGSSLWNYPGAHAGAAAEWATLNIPGLNFIWPYIQACAQMVGQWCSAKEGEPTKAFSEFVAENKAKADTKHSSGEDTYNALFERRARSSEIDEAGDIMRQAKKVADIDTAPIIDVAEEGGAIKSDDGKAATVGAADGNGPKVEDGVAVGGQGTTGDRIKSAFMKPFEPILEGMKGEHALAAGAGAAAGTYYIGKKLPNAAGKVADVAKGGGSKLAQLSRGFAAGNLQGAADMIGGSDFRKSHSLVNGRDAKLVDEKAARSAVDDLDSKEARDELGEKKHAKKLKAAEKNWAKMTEKLEEVDDAIKHGPAFSGTKWGSRALQLSDKATEVMGAANVTKLGRLARGAGRVAPWATAGFFAKDVWDVGNAVITGDGRTVQTSAASAGVVASGAAAGAGIGFFFGGFGAIPGAIIGAGVAGAGDFVGGLFGYGSKDIAGRNYDANHRPTPKQVEDNNMKAVLADPDVQAFVEAVEARDPQAMKMLVGNSEAAKNARLVLKASGVKVDQGAWITEDQLMAGGSKPGKGMSLAAQAAALI